ncbi:MAG: hypothetical protein ACKVP5_01855 [Aestuariivirga sp.]
MPVTIFDRQQVTAVTGANSTSTVGEPSLANSGKYFLYSGNWYAAHSDDHGATWTAIDPYAFFPPAHGGFCCDQTIHYDQAHDVTIWLLQYRVDAANTANTLRVAFKKGGFAQPGTWNFWDLVPASVKSEWAGEWFDYNHAALSNGFLFVGSNMFSIGANNWSRAVLFRFPLQAMADAGAVTFDIFETTTHGSLRCVQGATDTMYFASHSSLTSLRVFVWPDNSKSVTHKDIAVSATVPGPMSAAVPGSANWLSRCDTRITGAWNGNGIVGFMWTSNQNGTARPFPFVRVVRLDRQNLTLKDEPDIWNDQFAYAYPEAASNTQGIPGVGVFLGGGQRHPAHVVGFRDDNLGNWVLAIAESSTHSPDQPKWGDYLTCRRHAPDGVTWIASGYTLQGGGAIADVKPHYVHFGIGDHRPAVDRWQGV